MKTVIAERRGLLAVPAGDVDVVRLRELLTVVSSDGTEIQLCHEGKGVVRIPRNFPVDRVLLPRRVVRIHQEGIPARGPSVALPVGKWRVVTRPRDDTQRTALLRLEETSGTDRVLALGCGKGKTYLSLAYACSNPHRYPLLIVVPTTQLQNQWKREILTHTGLSEKDIALVGGGHGKEPGRIVTIGVLNSVSEDSFRDKWKHFFSLVIFDEAHRLGASLLGKAAESFVGERLSLTATFERDDGMEALYQHHLGPKVFEDVSSDLDPEVYFVRTGVNINENGYRWGGGPVQLPKLFNSLAKNKSRNQVAVSLLESSVKKGRVVLVLGERVKQLDSLTSLLLKNGIDAELLVGRMKGESKKSYQSRTEYSLTKARVVFATSKLAKEGLDRAVFDTLLILFPFRGLGRLRQSVGRVLRVSPGKRFPLVMVLQDSSFTERKSKLTGRMVQEEGALSRMYRSMYQNMLNLGYEVQTVDP